jgi:DNA-binding NtrC family response regulator
MRLLVVDDEENVRKGIVTFLELSGHQALAVGDLASARSALAAAQGAAKDSTKRDAAFQALLVDLYVGREDGSSLLELGPELRASAPIIMMSGKGRLKDAVDAVRRGAYDFLEKPMDTDRLLAILRNIEREAEALRRLDSLREDWLSEHVYMGEGGELAEAFESARKTAASPLSVLVTGPTGSGKELVARWIHLCSPRSRGPFVAVNCAAIPEELAESAFFGSRKGAFTGANSDSPGYFEAASGGTLFLDEVGELPPMLQAGLLRAVETGEIQPVGAQVSSRADVRIVAATNSDLRGDASSAFREDLFWRLAQARISLPSLAQRKSDIRGLAEFLSAPIRSGMGRDAPRLGEEAVSYLERRDWPGNVRELRAFLERALWLASPGSLIGREYLESLEAEGPRTMSRDAPLRDGLRAGAFATAREGPPGRDGAAAGDGGAAATASGEGAGQRLPLAKAKEDFERSYVAAALDEAGGSVAKAAELLGLLPNNLSRKIKELGLR